MRRVARRAGAAVRRFVDEHGRICDGLGAARAAEGAHKREHARVRAQLAAEQVEAQLRAVVCQHRADELAKLPREVDAEARHDELQLEARRLQALADDAESRKEEAQWDHGPALSFLWRRAVSRLRVLFMMILIF